MASIAYVTDKNMVEYHRLSGNRTMNFWRPSKSKKFADFQPGDLLFFLAKGSERGRKKEKGIVGYGRFQKANTLSFRQMWNKYGVENGYPTEDDLYDAIVKVSKSKHMPKTMNCLYLVDVVFFQSPIYLSELGINISNNVESYFYLDKEDNQATSKILNKAKENGMDMWMAAMSNTINEEQRFEEEEIKHQISMVYQKLNNGYNESDMKKVRKVVRQFLEKHGNNYEYIKGSKDDLISFGTQVIHIAVPFIYHSKDYIKKRQILLGKCIGYRLFFEEESRYNIPVRFSVITEEETLPEEILSLIERLNNLPCS